MLKVIYLDTGTDNTDTGKNQGFIRLSKKQRKKLTY
jgi:hypothetical protein